jgi:hypothetical protein
MLDNHNMKIFYLDFKVKYAIFVGIFNELM